MPKERIQQDSIDLMGQPVRLVFEKESEDPNEKNYISTLHYWIGETEVNMVFSNGREAMAVYKGLKSARSKVFQAVYEVESEPNESKVEFSEG